MQTKCEKSTTKTVFILLLMNNCEMFLIFFFLLHYRHSLHLRHVAFDAIKSEIDSWFSGNHVYRMNVVGLCCQYKELIIIF